MLSTIALMMIAQSSGLAGKATNVVSFPGGTPQALAVAMSQDNKLPVVIETSKSTNLPPILFDSSSVNTMGVSFHRPPLVLQPGVDLVLSDQAYVRSDFGSLLQTPTAPATGSVRAGALANGKVTLGGDPNSPISVGSLSKLPWSKPFKVNYLLSNLALSVVAKDVPEDQFLDMVRKAVGGQWVDRGDGRHLIPDTAQLRIRMTQTFTDTGATKDPTLAGRRNLFLTVVESLSDSDLTTLFDGPGGTVSGPIASGSDVAQAARNYLQVRADDEATHSNGQRHVVSDALQEVDNQRPVTMRIEANGIIHITVPIRNPRTGRRSSVSLQ